MVVVPYAGKYFGRRVAYWGECLRFGFWGGRGGGGRGDWRGRDGGWGIEEGQGRGREGEGQEIR